MDTNEGVVSEGSTGVAETGGAADVSTQNTAGNVENTPVSTPPSPIAQKAREALDNARKGVFDVKSEKTGDKVEQTPEKKDGVAVVAPVVVVPSAYQPNFKFKANKQELEFDELFKGLVKDADTEKKIRKLHEDAFGLEPVKAYAENLKQKHGEVSTKFNAIDRDLRMLSHHVRNDDFDSFFGDLQIPKDKIFNWVQKKLNEMSLEPAAQAELERNRQANRENFYLAEENNQFKSSQVEQSVQARTYELDMEIIKPDVAEIAQSFDAKVGRPGAFREECMNRGALAWQFAKKDISAAEAVQQVMSLMGRVMSPVAPATPVQVSGQPGGQNPPASNVVVSPPPVIPNISGKSTSPVRTAPKSVADLRKLAKNYSGAST